MKKSHWLGVLVLLSFGLGWVIGSLAGVERGADVDEGSEAVDAWDEQSGEKLERRLKSQAGKIAALEEALAAANAKLSVVEDTVSEAEVEEVSRFRQQMDMRMDRRVDRLAEQLGLSDAQKALVRGVFSRRLDMIEARRRGEEVEPFNLDAELGAVLSEEQFSAYMEESQEEIYNRAELMATGQLVRMNQLLNLDPEMEGVVYEAMHLTAQEMMIARETGESYPMREVLDERLGSLLSEEQMERLREEGGGFGMGPGRGFGGRGGP